MLMKYWCWLLDYRCVTKCYVLFVEVSSRDGAEIILSDHCKSKVTVMQLSRFRPMSHLQFSRASFLARDKIASVTWRVARVFNSRATLFPNRALLYSVQLCWQNAERLLVSRSVCNFIARLCCTLARQNCARKLQVWHRSYYCNRALTFCSQARCSKSFPS